MIFSANIIESILLFKQTFLLAGGGTNGTTCVMLPGVLLFVNTTYYLILFRPIVNIQLHHEDISNSRQEVNLLVL